MHVGQLQEFVQEVSAAAPEANIGTAIDPAVVQSVAGGTKQLNYDQA